jgi:hypothetical protein
MRKLDRRGVAALEFCVVAAAFFVTVFAIYDLGVYAITVQSLRSLADAGARATMVDPPGGNGCYTDAAITHKPPDCNVDDLLPLVDPNKAVAPFLYSSSGPPRLSMKTGAKAVTVTASQPGFTMLTPFIWPAVFNAPSVSTEIPF